LILNANLLKSIETSSRTQLTTEVLDNLFRFVCFLLGRCFCSLLTAISPVTVLVTLIANQPWPSDPVTLPLREKF